eukprot:1212656-Rhodomonas_salina.1
MFLAYAPMQSLYAPMLTAHATRSVYAATPLCACYAVSGTEVGPVMGTVLLGHVVPARLGQQLPLCRK